MHGETMEVQ